MRKTLSTIVLTLGLVFAVMPGALAGGQQGGCLPAEQSLLDPNHAPCEPQPTADDDPVCAAWINYFHFQLVGAELSRDTLFGQWRQQVTITDRQHARIQHLVRVKHRQARTIRHLRAELAAAQG